MDKLMGCPVCGPRNVRLDQFAAPATFRGECNWTTGGCGKGGPWMNSRESAIKAWNEALHE